MLWMHSVLEGAEQVGPAGDDTSILSAQGDGGLLERVHSHVSERRQRHQTVFPKALRTVSGLTGILSILTPMAL